MGLGPPSLTTRGVLGQTLAIGPIFSAAFLSGTVAVFAGFNTPLSVLLAGAGTLGLAYLITLVYLLLAGGALRLLWSDRDRGGLWWRAPVVLTGVAVPILSFDGSLDPFPEAPNDNAVYFACAALGLSTLWYAALRRLRPGSA